MKRWSFARRMTLWYAGTTATLILSIAGLSGWFLYQSVTRELDALVKEELDEASALFSASGGAVDDFREIAAELAREHPANPLGWRVWNADGSVWGEFGELGLLERAAVHRRDLDRTRRPGHGLRWRVEELGERRVAVVLDGSTQMEMLRRYGAFSVLFVLVGALMSWLVAAGLARKTSGMLRSIAHRARMIREPSESLELGSADLPVEVGDVVDALSEMLAKIRAESERADLMTSGLAHELRSPIQNLMGEAEVALMRERDSQEYRRVLESQLEELRELARAVDNLVTLCARRESEDSQEAFDLGQEALLRFDPGSREATRRDVRLELECSGDLRLDGDREALLLALRNLVSNAIQWSPDGGTVHISIEGRDAEVEVRVSDEGPGIPVDVRERVFEPFQQGPQSAGRRVGFGLGLALARTAVEIHGGRIGVEDAPEGGALMRVVLPKSS